MVVGFKTTNAISVVSLNPSHGEVYLIQYYVIKFVSDLRQVCGFLWVLRFPLQIKLTANDIIEILLKVVLSTIILTLTPMRQRTLIENVEFKFCITDRNNFMDDISFTYHSFQQYHLSLFYQLQQRHLHSLQ